MKASAGPVVVGAGCWAKAAVLMLIANAAAGMIVFMARGSWSLLEGIADGILGAPDRVLDLARRFLRGALCLCLRIAGHLADGLFDGPFHLMSRTHYPIFVHI